VVAGLEDHVVTMGKDDFFSNEKSVTVPAPPPSASNLSDADGAIKVLKEKTPLKAGEILDGTVMRKKALVAFYEEQIARAKRDGVLFSLHLKATMMKVSDPILFGHAVRVFFKDVFAKHDATFAELGVDLNNGFGDLVGEAREAARRSESRHRSRHPGRLTPQGPGVAMVNSDQGITNLHVPSDVIVDASMPAMIRVGGKMYDAKGKLQDTLAVIPDSCYAGIYQVTVDFCRQHGAFDPRTMGSVPNVGLMAQAAEEYGSHNKTFQISGRGTVRVVDDTGKVLIEHAVEDGDVWRACQTKDAAVQDWVKLAVNRARLSATPAIFWLDEARAHDAQRHRQGQDVPGRTAIHAGSTCASSPRPRPAAPRSSASGSGKTPSPSPAMCCATTSPTSSRSSRSARARRCCRLCP
jgi:isocitrate dehydrogenase